MGWPVSAETMRPKDEVAGRRLGRGRIDEDVLDALEAGEREHRDVEWFFGILAADDFALEARE